MPTGDGSGHNGPPGAPQFEVERLVTRLMTQAEAVLTAQQRLQRLLAANRSIVGELSLPAVLRRIVDAAREVAGARYAALGVIGPDGLLEQFIHVGMDAETVAKIGELPKGRGLLGAVLNDPRPTRVGRILDDERSTGFPPGHPAMTTFLGVPVRSRDEVFGNLYLTDRLDGGQFTAEDEELMLALAATAGIAIENARLYEEARRRQEWLRASGEISRQLVRADVDHRDVLQRIASSVKRLAAADVVSVVVPVEGSADVLQVVAVSGRGERELRGLLYPRENSVAWQAMLERQGVRIENADQAGHSYLHMRPVVPVSDVMALPLTGEAGPSGAIVAGRTGRVPFTDADLNMAEAFAGQAAVALELAAARADQQRLEVLEDRDRIARDLHDHVIQRLFAAGLSVQSTATSTREGGTRDKLIRVVGDLDDTISRIRTTIFALHETMGGRHLRRTALAVVDQVAPMLPSRPILDFVGPLDSISDVRLVDEVEAVLRESLTNVAKHAQATAVRIELAATEKALSLAVIDDGVGLCAEHGQSGLTNLRDRAENLGGQLTLDDNPRGGLRLRWTVPLP